MIDIQSQRTTRPELTESLWSPSTMINGVPRQAASEEALLDELGLTDPCSWDDAGALRLAATRIHEHLLATPAVYRELVRSILYRIEDAQAEVWLTTVQHRRPQQNARPAGSKEEESHDDQAPQGRRVLGAQDLDLRGLCRQLGRLLRSGL